MSKLPPKPKALYAERCEITWSFLVRLPRKCVRCGHKGPLEDFHAHHIIRRNAKCLMFVLDNGACVCADCHHSFVHDTSPKGVERAEAWMQEKFADRLDRLEEMKRTLMHHRDWRFTFDSLWLEIVKRGAVDEWARYVDSHPAIARLWAGAN